MTRPGKKRRWLSIDTAPTDGTIVMIKGRRFQVGGTYSAEAVWTRRRCPRAMTTGWFPPSDRHDGAGPYGDVTHWMPLL